MLNSVIDNVVASSVDDNTAPGNGAVYYLMRSSTLGLCNLTPNTFKAGFPKEVPGSGGDRDVDIAADPDNCTP